MLKRFNNLYFKEITLDEEGNDYLGNKHYADELESQINEYFMSEEKKPMYIGLVGTWGSGKTTIVETVLKRYESKKNTKVFRYDAWKYEDDSFRRTFVKEILTQCGVSQKTKDSEEYIQLTNELYDDKSVGIKSISEKNKLLERLGTPKNKKLRILGWFLCFIISFFTGVDINVAFLSILFTAGVVEILVLILGEGISFFKADVTYNSPKLFSTEQFYESFKKILNQYVGVEKEKIVLIDNLDRCSNEELVKTMSAIKGFFEENQKIVYIVPFDAEQFGSAFDHEYLSYSEKIFNYTIDIKENSVNNVMEFLGKLLDNFPIYQEIFNSTIIDIIVKSNCKTPRQILKCFNNYIVEYNLFISKNTSLEVVEDEDLKYLMKYTIMKSYFKPLFSWAHLDMDVIEILEKTVIKGTQSYDEIKDNYDSVLSRDVFNFLKATKNIIPTNYGLFYNDNDNKTFSIDKKLENAIYEKDIEKVNEIINNDSIKQKFLSYMKNTVIYANSKELWDTEITPKLDLGIALLRNQILSLDEFNEIYGVILENSDALEENIIRKNLIQVKEIAYASKQISNRLYIKYKGKYLSNMTNGFIRVEETEKNDLILQVYTVFDYDSFDDQQTTFFGNFITDIINSNNFREDKYLKLFSVNISKLINDAQYSSILNRIDIRTNPIDKNIIDKILTVLKDRFKESIDSNLYSRLLQCVSRNNSYCEDESMLSSISDIIIENSDNLVVSSSYNQFAFNIKSGVVLSDSVIKKFCELLRIYNFSHVSTALLNCGNNKIILKSIEENDDFKTPNFTLDHINRVLPQEYENYKKEIANIYSQSNDIMRSSIVKTVINNHIGGIIDIYGSLEKAVKEDFIDKVFGNPLSFEQDVIVMKLHESSTEKYDSIINKYSSIDERVKLLLATTKVSMKNKISKILMTDIIDKDNIIGADMENIIKFIVSCTLSDADKIKICDSLTGKVGQADLIELSANLDEKLRNIILKEELHENEEVRE
jgi:Ni2+-binding GTPase involved in regulation of expression and maturation of urease and hydrogenase